MNVLKQQRSNIVTALILALCVVFYIKATVLGPIPWMAARRDFIHYWQEGKTILARQSPYASTAWFYPPLYAFLMVPFGFTDYVTARWIWFVISHAFLLIAAWLIWRATGRDRLALCCVALVWAFCGGAGETLEGGQVGPLLILIFAIAYVAKPANKGLALGAGFALKYIPGVPTVALVLNRAWNALAAFAVTAIVGLLVPWAVLLLFYPPPYTPLKPHYWMGTPHILSWSVPSVVLRILDPVKRGDKIPYNWDFGNVVDQLRLSRTHELISAASGALVLIAGIVTLILVCRGKLNTAQVPWAMAGLVSLSLAATPVCWTHYQVFQYPGIALLFTDGVRRRVWLFTAAVVVCAAMLNPLPVAVLTAYFKAHGGFSAASPATLYIWSSVTPLACLGVFGLSLIPILRERS